MWLELGVAVLALLVVGQGVVLWQVRVELKRLCAVSEAVALTDVPTSMLVAVLSRVQRTLEAKPVTPMPEPVQERSLVRMREVASVAPAASSYDVARRLVSEGAGADQLVEHCGLSRGEAELLRSLHAAREGMGASRPQ